MANELALSAEIADSLPFDLTKQIALLGYIVNTESDKVFLQVKDHVKRQWWSDAFAGQLFEIYLEFWKTYKKTPLSKDELFCSEMFMSRDPAARAKMKGRYEEAFQAKNKFSSDVLLKEVSNWIKVQIFHKRVEESARHFNGKRISQAFGVLEDAIKETHSIHFDGNTSASFENLTELVNRQMLDTTNAVTTGIPLLDEKLLDVEDSRKNGALLRGDTTVVMASTNVGKTTALVTMAAHNIRRGKNILFITHEGREADLQEKIVCALLETDRNTFRNMVLKGTANDKNALEAIQGQLNRQMTYISLNTVGLTVEDVIRTIRMEQNKRRASNGNGYDLLIDDYPSVLTSEYHRGQKAEHRIMQDYIYRQFVQVALEENFHAILAAQTNRDASRTNRGVNDRGGSGDRRLLTVEDIAEAFGIAQSATNFLTLNRSDVDKANNRMTFYVCKSRSSQTGWAITVKTAFEKSLSFATTSQSVAYQGSSTKEDKIEQFLRDFNNGVVPYSELSK